MPQLEAFVPKHGVSTAFLKHAEEYFTRLKKQQLSLSSNPTLTAESTWG
jgi:hypothetical protein